MPALNASTTPQADGSIMIRWNQIAPATGYVAWTIGGMDRQDKGGDIIWWTSSASKEFGGGLWDWLPPATVANHAIPALKASFYPIDRNQDVFCWDPV